MKVQRKTDEVQITMSVTELEMLSELLNASLHGDSYTQAEPTAREFLKETGFNMKVVKKDETPFTGTMILNGYSFGDRMLEGCWFHVDVVDGVITMDSVRPTSETEQYFENFNREKWLNEARTYLTAFDGEETVCGIEVYNDESGLLQMAQRGELG